MTNSAQPKLRSIVPLAAAIAGVLAIPVATAADAPTPPVIQTKPITPGALANTRFMFSGFVKLDALWSKYDDGDIADDTTGRDFYVPSATPVGAPLVSEGADLKMHAKQSRLIFGTDTDLADKSTITSRFEFDLYASSLGNQRATNTYGVQLRQAYFQYKGWLAGQTWTNFQDIGTLPETADYIGATDGTVFVRQAQVRYTAGGFSISAENPETTITPFGGGTQISSDDGALPDITAAYNFKFGNGSNIRAAALVRELRYQVSSATAGSSFNASKFAGGISVAGKIVMGSHDDIRFMATYGQGVGRYLGLNFANDAVLTAATTNIGPAGVDLKAISGFGAFAAWRHAWTSQVRTSLIYAMQSYDNDRVYTGTGVNKSSNSIAVNLFYSPVPKIDIGVEARVAKRELESGVDGTMKRLQATAKYSF